MKEVIDKSTGAILFKSNMDDPMERKMIELENQVSELRTEVRELKYLISKLVKDK